MVGLSERAFLEIDLSSERTGVFELHGGFSEDGELTRDYVFSNRGQFARQAYDILSDQIDAIDDADLPRRRGYHIDGGAGRHQFTVSFETGYAGNQWGDGSSDPADEDDLTKYDATGCGPVDQKQVLEHYVAEARTDSSGNARLYHGQWTDGSYADEAGVFGEPLVVAVDECRIEWSGGDKPSSIDGTLELTRTALLPDVDDALEGVQDAIDDLVDSLGDQISDV